MPNVAIFFSFSLSSFATSSSLLLLLLPLDLSTLVPELSTFSRSHTVDRSLATDNGARRIQLIAGFGKLEIICDGPHYLLIFGQGFAATFTTFNVNSNIDTVEVCIRLLRQWRGGRYMFCSIEIKCNKLHDDRTRCQKSYVRPKYHIRFGFMFSKLRNKFHRLKKGRERTNKKNVHTKRFDSCIKPFG